MVDAKEGVREKATQAHDRTQQKNSEEEPKRQVTEEKNNQCCVDVNLLFKLELNDASERIFR